MGPMSTSGGHEMATAVLGVATRDTVTSRFLHAFEGREEGHLISFASPSLLFETLTAGRWELLAAMQGAGPLDAADVTKLVGRDIEGVRADVRALLHAGILDQAADGKVVFPYDSLRVDFSLRAA
jgi:predicted transcriptional regulator